MKREIVLIGDYLGTIEEFVPGKGTFAENGKIYASITGNVIIDRVNHIATVKGKIVPELEIGQIVFGEVINIKKNNITIIVKKISGYNIQLDERASLYVSNIANTYVEKPEDAFGIGDIVKARVISVNTGSIYLSTKGNLGVVLAFCKRCRHTLRKMDKRNRYGNTLICPNCSYKERRKIANDYGNVKL